MELQKTDQIRLADATDPLIGERLENKAEPIRLAAPQQFSDRLADWQHAKLRAIIDESEKPITAKWLVGPCDLCKDPVFVRLPGDLRPPVKVEGNQEQKEELLQNFLLPGADQPTIAEFSRQHYLSRVLNNREFAHFVQLKALDPEKYEALERDRQIEKLREGVNDLRKTFDNSTDERRDWDFIVNFTFGIILIIGCILAFLGLLADWPVTHPNIGRWGAGCVMVSSFVIIVSLLVRLHKIKMKASEHVSTIKALEYAFVPGKQKEDKQKRELLWYQRVNKFNKEHFYMNTKARHASPYAYVGSAGNYTPLEVYQVSNAPRRVSYDFEYGRVGVSKAHMV